MSQITTHVLDTSRGMPGIGINISLQIINEDFSWTVLATGKTNDDGRISDLLPKTQILKSGVYRLVFHTEDYFNALGTTSFYPIIPIVFKVFDASHYHVPLLLNPFGYSTYRGT